MRGEKSRRVIARTSVEGSPPHARGKVGVRLEREKRDGITPACAGKRAPIRARVSTARDHPRMRGEKTDIVIPLMPGQGSPPHARGKDNPISETTRHARITPACAGKRCISFAGKAAAQDHPRMRGEKSLICIHTSAQPGSPPHARGKELQSWINGA